MPPPQSKKTIRKSILSFLMAIFRAIEAGAKLLLDSKHNLPEGTDILLGIQLILIAGMEGSRVWSELNETRKNKVIEGVWKVIDEMGWDPETSEMIKEKIRTNADAFFEEYERNINRHFKVGYKLTAFQCLTILSLRIKVKIGGGDKITTQKIKDFTREICKEVLNKKQQ